MISATETRLNSYSAAQMTKLLHVTLCPHTSATRVRPPAAAREVVCDHQVRQMGLLSVGNFPTVRPQEQVDLRQQDCSN